jgi:hypothetical protein
MKRRVTLFLIFLVAMLIGGAWWSSSLHRSPEIKMGMTEDQVSHVMGRKPDGGEYGPMPKEAEGVGVFRYRWYLQGSKSCSFSSVVARWFSKSDRKLRA